MDERLLHACDVNMWVANAAFLGTSANGEVLESHDLFITNCGLPATEFNRAFLKEPSGDLPVAFERAEAYFDSMRLPFAYTLRSDYEAVCSSALLAAGHERQEAVPGMVLAPIRDGAEPPPELEIREVATEVELELFRETAFVGFGLPKQLGHIFISEQFLGKPGVKLYLGLLDGRPVCTSSLVPTPGIAGIYWVATLAEYRGRGLGEAITWAAVRGGMAAGCDIASLQASVAGEPVYLRMGFEIALEYLKYGSS